MKKLRAVLRLMIALALLSSVLCGCEIGPHSIESLMRPPHAAGERELEKALGELLGSGFTLRVPQSGGYHTAVTLRDLNGDRADEAVVFYSSAANSFSLCVLEQSDGAWRIVKDCPVDGSGVYSLDFTDMNGDGYSEILVGWYMYNDTSKKSLTVYACSNSGDRLTVSPCATEPYDYYLFADVNGSGEKQLFLAYTDVSQSPIDVTLKRVGLDASGQITAADALPIDPRVVRIDSLTSDHPENGQPPRIFVDALLSDNQMITEVFLWSEEQNDFDCPFHHNKQGYNTATQRSNTLKCADVNEDGLIEIPLRKKFNWGKEEEIAMGYLLTWCGVQGDQIVPEVYYAVNAAENYRLLMPKEWNGKVFVKYTDTAYWSFVNQEEEALFTITVHESRTMNSSGASVTVLDDTSSPGVTYSCHVAEKGRAFGITEDVLKEYFEYYAGGNTK